ncbi:hypothetical protein LTR84_008840 [Exophiala bonariae]|uniref:Myb-like domain-containing protein n=1 Tax=Exophiala bonariae TaxID=1690606 RepID=A0AAV9MXU7_9EURO|nr:hypothetical protein LTR84_008840 [Exophiala bonariae]
MSFYNAKESFFMEALASTIRPIVEIVPLTDTDVFQYLDAHPKVLQKYFEERQGLLKSFNKPATGDQCVLCGFGAPCKQQLSFSKTVVIAESATVDEEINADEGSFSEHGLDPALWEVPDFSTIWTPTFDLFPDSFPSPPVSPWAVPASPSTAAATATDSLPAKPTKTISKVFTLPSRPATNSVPSTGSNTIPASRKTPSASEKTFPVSGKALSIAGTTRPKTGKTLPPTTSSSLPQSHSTTANGPKKQSRKWSPEEESSCIEHMSAVVKEGIITGEARFREAGRRMKEIDGFERTKSTAIKNFWNRVGRARSGIDERKNRNAPLATSQQGKSAKLSVPKPSQSQRKTPTMHRSRSSKQESDSDSDSYDEQDLVSPDTTVSPPTTPGKRTRRSILDSDSESDWESQLEQQQEQALWEPDDDILNAIAKGVRPRKQARTGY